MIDFSRTPEGVPYVVMEFLEGVELAAEIRRAGPMPVDRVVRLVEHVASALSAAHKRGVVHLDLKPQNLFLVPVEGPEHELVKVLDFGISKVTEATHAVRTLSADVRTNPTCPYLLIIALIPGGLVLESSESTRR